MRSVFIFLFLVGSASAFAYKSCIQDVYQVRTDLAEVIDYMEMFEENKVDELNKLRAAYDQINQKIGICETVDKSKQLTADLPELFSDQDSQDYFIKAKKDYGL